MASWLTCALAAHQVLALRLVGVDGRDGDGVLGVGVQVLQEVGGLLAAHDGLEAEVRVNKRLLYNQRSRPLVVRRENAALTHEA